MDLKAALRARGGTAMRRDLLKAGVGAWQLRTAGQRDGVVVPYRGVVALAGAPPEFAEAYRHGGLLTCISAAPHHGLWQLHPASELHLVCGNGLPRDGVVPHRRASLPPLPGRPVAALGDVLVHVLRCRPAAEALVMVQCAVVRGDITVDFLRGKLPGNRNGRARGVLDFVCRRADSLLEPLAAMHFRQAGIGFVQHVELSGVGEVDFVVEGFLIVELDGKTHFEPRAIKRDRRRDNTSVAGGFTVLRYFYEDVVHHPETMVAEVRATIRAHRAGLRLNK
ncbi:endonuclease domain-containing protein [Arthrobacter sp. FW306-04-A]|uniref:endonuclease domain-containing protein n=1 Tax=Arthrobacter sp. FW306-04-A TaxID=2879619 RepID=UPI0037C1381A|nr:endonuclease domain-containing protein [Arthrobacter sp. FW306-04-A]